MRSCPVYDTLVAFVFEGLPRRRGTDGRQLRRRPAPNRGGTSPIVVFAVSGVRTSNLTERPPRTLNRFGVPLLGAAESLGLRFVGIQRDLAVTERTLGRHLAEKMALGLFGMLLVPLTSAVMYLGGLNVPLAIPLWAGLILGIVFFFVPDLGVKGEAAGRRREFRHVLGAFVDLVVIDLAGGAGVESALADATECGDGWAFGRLRRALDGARLRQESPWKALGRLGDELGISELVELSASVGLAGTEGAKVRASLAAKAASLRNHQLSDAEAEAQSMTEKMSLPVVALFGGFLIFVGYPAMARILTGL